MLALWRIAADLKSTNSFAIPSGLFSHWQVWLGAAVAAATVLARAEPLRQRRGRGRLPDGNESSSDILADRSTMPQPRFGYRSILHQRLLPARVEVAHHHQRRGLPGVFPRRRLDSASPDRRCLRCTPQARSRSLYIWQIFTYMFLHGGISHLLFNMLTLWLFGTPARARLGHPPFPEILLLSAGSRPASASWWRTWLIGDWDIPTIGASGAIFGVLVAFGVLYPNQTVLMNFLFPIKAKYMVMIYAAIELLHDHRPGQSGVSTIAHLGGMAFGYVYLKGRLPRVQDSRLAGRLPAVEAPARQEEVPGLHEETRQRAVGELRRLIRVHLRPSAAKNRGDAEKCKRDVGMPTSCPATVRLADRFNRCAIARASPRSEQRTLRRKALA